jgi:N-acetylmuramoyl-L-alanine amidase
LVPPTPPPAANSGPRHYFAVIDASHGGTESGAILGGPLLEKDVTLAIARRLRQEMETRGMSALLLRDNDSSLTLDQRASAANAARPAIYVCIHAASLGTGVRIYTAMLPPPSESRGPFTDWNTAQASFAPMSQAVAMAAMAEFQTKQIPARTLEAPLRPLNNITAAAIGLEAAPPGDTVSQLASASYQEQVATLMAQTLANMRSRLEAGR